MKTKTITLYTFDELSDSAKEAARQWHREASSYDTFWSDCVIDDAKEQGEYLGIDIDKVYWSGFWSQGDGACFVGDWYAGDVKVEMVAEGWGDSPETTELRRIAGIFAEIAEKYPNARFSVKHSGHYSHKYSTTFDVSLGEDEDNGSVSQEEWSQVEADLIEVARDYMEWIYRSLESEYEHQTSDEAVDENILANEYTFTEDGERED